MRGLEPLPCLVMPFPLNYIQKFLFQSCCKCFNKTIGIVRGYHYPIFDQAHKLKAIKKVERADEDELLKLLINERIHQVFINKQVFQYLQKHNPKYKQLKIGGTVGKYNVAIRVHPAHAELIPILNNAIKALKESGEIDKIFKANQYP